MGLAAMVGCPPSQTEPLSGLCLFTALRHSDHKSGRVIAIVTER